MADQANETTEDTTPSPGSSGADAQTHEAVVAERDKYLEIAKRTRAEFENYQKRASRDAETERKYAAKPLLGDLLPVIDNLDRALASAKGKPDPTGIVQGIEIVRKQLSDALDRHGVAVIDPMGEMFDPNQHEAILQQPSPGAAPMTVLHVAQVGYKLHDRVIRPAHVVVAAAEASAQT
jgi:molecular chaperone GrpE